MRLVWSKRRYYSARPPGGYGAAGYPDDGVSRSAGDLRCATHTHKGLRPPAATLCRCPYPIRIAKPPLAPPRKHHAATDTPHVRRAANTAPDSVNRLAARSRVRLCQRTARGVCCASTFTHDAGVLVNIVIRTSMAFVITATNCHYWTIHDFGADFKRGAAAGVFPPPETAAPARLR